MLTELVANAVQHGLADASGEISVEAERDNHLLRVEVTDNGTGLAEGRLARVLELRSSELWLSPSSGEDCLDLAIRGAPKSLWRYLFSLRDGHVRSDA